MTVFQKILLITFIFTYGFQNVSGSNDSLKVQKQDYQIYLKQPAKSIKLLMYEKDFTPIQGIISEDKKSIIIKNYKTGTRVHVKVEYEDGTFEEFVKSPCFIDPVITEIKKAPFISPLLLTFS
jgi:hypothetical protein